MEAITTLHTQLQSANSEFEQLHRMNKKLDEELKQATFAEESSKAEQNRVSKLLLDGKIHLQEENVSLDTILQELHSIEVENSCLKTELTGLTGLITKCALIDYEDENHKTIASTILLSKGAASTGATKLKIKSILEQIEKCRENAKKKKENDIKYALKEAVRLRY